MSRRLVIGIAAGLVGLAIVLYFLFFLDNTLLQSLVSSILSQCNDGRDNDVDGLCDYDGQCNDGTATAPDPGCRDSEGNYDPDDNDESR